MKIEGRKAVIAEDNHDVASVQKKIKAQALLLKLLRTYCVNLDAQDNKYQSCYVQCFCPVRRCPM